MKPWQVYSCAGILNPYQHKKKEESQSSGAAAEPLGAVKKGDTKKNIRFPVYSHQPLYDMFGVTLPDAARNS